MNSEMAGPISEVKKIVIIGGGIVGTSTAYFLTRHALFNPKVHSIVLLEASQIAGGSSGKGGGFIADWAIPKSIASLSFNLHGQLAEEHDGAKVWGHRTVYAAEIKLLARKLDSDPEKSDDARPPALDWILPGSVEAYDEIGTPKNSGQVNPYMFTKTLAKLAEEKGVEVRIGSAVSRINYHENERVKSVTASRNGIQEDIEATDILVAAGPWTPRLLSQISLLTPRGHSVITKPTRPLSPYVLFPNIKPAPNNTFRTLISPDIYPRPADGMHDFDTVYASGPDGYSVPLPDSTEDVEVDEKLCDDVKVAINSVSREIHDGEVVAVQACYKPQIRKHEEEEETGPIVGPMSIKGLWVATGHDEWGIQNAPATGLLMSEMIMEGKARSADVKDLDPKHFVKAPE